MAPCEVKQNKETANQTQRIQHRLRKEHVIRSFPVGFQGFLGLFVYFLSFIEHSFMGNYKDKQVKKQFD